MPTSSESLVALPATVDLHARPAADFVRCAMGFSCDITACVRRCMGRLVVSTNLRFDADSLFVAGRYVR